MALDRRAADRLVRDLAVKRGVAMHGFHTSGEYRRALGIAQEPDDGARVQRICIAVDDYRKRTEAEALNDKKADALKAKEAARAAG